MKLGIWFVALVIGGLAPAHSCVLSVRQHPDPSVLQRMPNGDLSGPQVEIVREAARRMGCAIKVVPLPWARALYELQEGRLDVLPEAHRAPDRESYAWFSDSTWPIGTKVYMRLADIQSKNVPANLEAFFRQRMKLGLQVGVRYGATIDKILEDRRFEKFQTRVPAREGLWRMLAAGRIDGVLATEHAGKTELASLGLSQLLTASPIQLYEEPNHTAFSRISVSRETVKKYDSAIDAMRRDGSISRIERSFQP